MQESQYELEVLVNGKPVREYLHKGKTFIEGKEGTEFSLRVRNRTGKRALFVPTIDGLSVMNGKEASFDSSGYIVGAYSTETIDGWRTSDDEVAKFYFAKVAESYAARTNKAGNTGIIGCAVFNEKEQPPKPIVVQHYNLPYHECHNWPHCSGCHCGRCTKGVQHFFGTTSGGIGILSSNVNTSNLSMQASVSNSAQDKASFTASSLGTGFGEQKHSPVRTVDFERQSKPTVVVTLHYNTRENLAAMGVEFRRPLYVAPSAFPKEDDYCKPPVDGTYYGPHPCDRCGDLIARLSIDEGGDKYDYPVGPIYPNTAWHLHKCKN